MAKSAAEVVRGAVDRARGRRALVHFLATSAGGFAVYAVGSTADVDTAYRMTVRGAAYRCACAAELRPACWHRAAVAMVRANRVAWGLPAAGPSAEQERAERVVQARQGLAGIAELFAA
jgi:hypothetical protein